MKTILVAAAVAAVWSGAPASAQTSRPVVIRDLDLSRPADVATLDRRLAAAARRVCAEPGSAVFGTYAAAKSCERATAATMTAQRDAMVMAAQATALAAR